MNRPVGTSLMTASSSQLSQSRRTTSTASAASSNSSHDLLRAGGRSRRPEQRRLGRRAGDTRACQPARPPLMWSSVASAVARWNGSVWVVVATGTSPTCRVSGATREATSTASSRPRTGPRSSEARAEGVLDASRSRAAAASASRASRVQ